MAQPANKRTLLGIDLFVGQANNGYPLRCEKWRVQYKLELPAKENIILGTLLGPKPEMVDLPLQSIYEETIIGSSAQSERERNARNAQQKMAKQVPTSNRNCHKVWRQALASCGLKNSVPALPQHRSGRTSDPEQ